MSLNVSVFKGEDITPHIAALARLRIQVFREFPYLYDGDLAYEASYLNVYLQCPDSMAGIAFDHDQVIGATTALPLNAADPAFTEPFLSQSLPLDDYFYFGESILLPPYRGQGLGHRFFDIREKAALEWGARATCFCAVERPADHPLKPADFHTLEAFWKKRGYEKTPERNCALSWKEVSQPDPSAHSLVFWQKSWQ